MDLDQARFFMVEQQIRPWDVLDYKILNLFMDIPRHEFISGPNKVLAYSDISLEVDCGQKMLEPKVEARMLQALNINENDTVLEIGTCVGFVTALLSSLAKIVTTVDISDKLQTIAKTNLKDYSNIMFEQGDASENWHDGKQYNVIFIGGAFIETPTHYKEKLTIGGRLVITTGLKNHMVTQLITRIAEDQWLTEDMFETCMPYLEKSKQLEDVFEF